MKTKQRPSIGRTLFWYGIHGVVLFGLAGCTGMAIFGPTSAALHLDIVPKPGAGQIVSPLSPVVLRVTKYTDARPAAASGKIGDINATVLDMFNRELVLEDLTGTVTTAIANQLSASGFQTLTADSRVDTADADFEVGGVIREFSLNIGGRDEVAIVLETTLRDTRHHSVLWSGAVVEKADRYAGVTGNTRNSITRYLSAALAKVSAKTRDAISASITQTYPERFGPAAPASGETSGANATRASSGHRSAAPPAHAAMTGRLAVSTLPGRARVYVADVYYGLSPLKLEMDPGIYTINIKLDAFKTASEKVSVRRGKTTEMEITLEK